MSQTPDSTKKADALAFLNAHNAGVLSTLSKAGTPSARLLYYVCDDAFNIYFLTLGNTRKVEDLTQHPHAAFTVAALDVPQTVQMEGIVDDISEKPVSDELVHRMFEQLKSNVEFHAPLMRFDSAQVKFFRLTPSWIRWGDFTQGQNSGEVFFEIAP